MTRARGWRVVATWFSRDPHLTDPALAAAPAVAWRRLDVTDGDAVHALVADLRPAAIIHTAYQMSGPDMERVIVDGSRHIAQAAGAARLVHMSTDVVFDGQRGHYRESDLLHPVHAYGRAKAAAEAIVRQTAPSAAIVRTSLVYGFDPPDPRTAWTLDSARGLNDITLFTDEFRCPIFAPDLADALLELAADDWAGPLHIAGAERLSRYEFGRRLCQAVGVDPDRLKPALAHDSGLIRPLDCSLDTTLGRHRLTTPLRGVTQVVADCFPPH